VRVSPTRMKHTHIFSPRSGRWSDASGPDTPLFFGAAVVLHSGDVLAIGGGSSMDIPRATVQSYNAHTGRWSHVQSMHDGRYGLAATVLQDGRVLVSGGAGGRDSQNVSSLTSAELYDPRTGTWTRTGSMHDGRSFHTATLLQNGKVLVTGGSPFGAQGMGALTTSEIYDPRMGTWTRTGSMADGRYGQAAVLLPRERVLVVGGEIAYAAHGYAELYDARTGEWMRMGRMHNILDGVTATRLDDGAILVAGGAGGPTPKAANDGKALATTELAHLP